MIQKVHRLLRDAALVFQRPAVPPPAQPRQYAVVSSTAATRSVNRRLAFRGTSLQHTFSRRWLSGRAALGDLRLSSAGTLLLLSIGIALAGASTVTASTFSPTGSLTSP